jgi:hypothetical protein
LIKVFDVSVNLLDSLESEKLSESELLHYFRDNQRLLRNNIEQAYFKYKENDLAEIVRRVFPEIISYKDLILSNRRLLAKIIDHISEKIISILGSAPNVIVVPCVGLFVASGWASTEGGHHVFIALEWPHRNMDIILAHEVAHV